MGYTGPAGDFSLLIECRLSQYKEAMYEWMARVEVAKLCGDKSLPDKPTPPCEAQFAPELFQEVSRLGDII